MDGGTPQAYEIKCQGGCVAVSTERLHRLFQLMPILRMILLGHPAMRVADDSPNGISRLLSLHDDYQVSHHAFSQLLVCALGISELPEGRDDREQLVTVANILGGCVQMEERVQQVNASEQEQANRASISARRGEAVTPATDTFGMFEWRSVGPQYCYMGIENAANLQTEGFEYAGAQEVGTNPQGIVALVHHFRRSRDVMLAQKRSRPYP
mmetsp:Transcript_16855/g.36512  ORF Transcript_16855/g.36512 Transcript_16855/m.36512 type:complete len:211 (+) Transcript_16855:109-741(+)